MVIPVLQNVWFRGRPVVRGRQGRICEDRGGGPKIGWIVAMMSTKGISIRGRLTLVIFMAAPVLFWGTRDANASWFIDAGEFHVSAHGGTSCLDCHWEVGRESVHPDPGRVNDKKKDFFDSEQCLACHDQVTADLDQGFHGSKRIRTPAKYEMCLRCHRPHRERPRGEDRPGFDPGIPRGEQCGVCHAPRDSLPPPSSEDAACLKCHRAVNPDDPAGKRRIQGFCFHCHAEGRTAAGGGFPRIDEEAYKETAHGDLACTACHPEAAQFGHGDQAAADCLDCHVRHDEKIARDAHLRVACAACHLNGVLPVKMRDPGRVVWKRDPARKGPSEVHIMTAADEEGSCERCHVQGNSVGAAAMVLPAKSIICMPCHAATLSVGDTITVSALVIFLIGVAAVLSYGLSGTMSGNRARGRISAFRGVFQQSLAGVFSRKTVLVARALVMDVLFQRRLYRRSPARWFIHGLIFYPFVFRFAWGLWALLGSLISPESGTVWAMLDKNHPLTGFLFDATGVMILAGLGMALLRGWIEDSRSLPGLPGRDRIVLFLIGAVVILGFLLEGVRIAMTGGPPGSGYAFVGYLISLLVPGSSFWTGIYGYLWYAHALLTGAFIAYLPFSRLFHIIMAPVAIAIHAVKEDKHRAGQ